MGNEAITLQVCIKREIGEKISRIFISKSDYAKIIELGYPISVVENKEYFVPTSSELYEHHYEVKSFDLPKNEKIEFVTTPFVYSAQPSNIHTKVR